MPTILAAAGTAPDPAYPPDGMNLFPQFTADPRRFHAGSTGDITSTPSALFETAT